MRDARCQSGLQSKLRSLSAALPHAPQVIGLLMHHCWPNFTVSFPSGQCLSFPSPGGQVTQPGSGAPLPVTLFSCPCWRFLNSVQNALAWKIKQDCGAGILFKTRAFMSEDCVLATVGMYKRRTRSLLLQIEGSQCGFYFLSQN